MVEAKKQFQETNSEMQDMILHPKTRIFEKTIVRKKVRIVIKSKSRVANSYSLNWDYITQNLEKVRFVKYKHSVVSKGQHCLIKTFTITFILCFMVETIPRCKHRILTFWLFSNCKFLLSFLHENVLWREHLRFINFITFIYNCLFWWQKRASII